MACDRPGFLLLAVVAKQQTQWTWAPRGQPPKASAPVQVQILSTAPHPRSVYLIVSAVVPPTKDGGSPRGRETKGDVWRFRKRYRMPPGAGPAADVSAIGQVAGIPADAPQP